MEVVYDEFFRRIFVLDRTVVRVCHLLLQSFINFESIFIDEFISYTKMLLNIFELLITFMMRERHI